MTLARFRREAEIASKRTHPNIIQVADLNTLADGSPYLMLELSQGESLASRLAQRRLTLDRAIAAVRQIGSRLAPGLSASDRGEQP